MNEPFSLTEVNLHGEWLGTFNSRLDKKRFLLPIGFAIFSLPFLLIGLAVVTSNEENERLFGLFFVGFSLIFCGISGYAILQNFHEGHWRVQTFTTGMLITRKSEDKLVRWSEIKSVKRKNLISYSFGEGDGIPLGTYCIYTVEMRDGTKHTFSGIKVQQLGDLINDYWKMHREKL